MTLGTKRQFLKAFSRFYGCSDVAFCSFDFDNQAPPKISVGVGGIEGVVPIRELETCWIMFILHFNFILE